MRRRFDWVELTKLNAGNTTMIWVNLQMVAGLEPKAERRTLVYFGAGHVAVAETPDEILGLEAEHVFDNRLQAHYKPGTQHIHLGTNDPNECDICNPPKSPENSLS